MSTKKTGKNTQQTKAKAAPRRTPRPKAKPPLVRGEAVVQKIFDAALQELGESGYRGFRIEEVAARAQVNKTTIYRRWPVKADLVREVLMDVAPKGFTITPGDSLRADLFALGRAVIEHCRHHLGRSLFRMLAAESSDPELRDILRSLRARNQMIPRAMLANAVTRGELAPGIDPDVILGALVGALHQRVFLMDEEVDDAFLTALIDLLLHGALRPSAASTR